MEAVSVVCVRRHSSVSAVYVNALYHMVCRHLKRPFRFYCITDHSEDLISEIKVVARPKSPHIETLHWFEVELFSPEMPFYKSHVLFLDVNLVIVANINRLFNFKDQLMMVRTVARKENHRGKTAVFSFYPEAYKKVWRIFKETSCDVLKEKYAHAEAFLWDVLPRGLLHFWPSQWCKSFVNDCLGGPWRRFQDVPTPLGSKIVLFNKGPTIQQALEGRWPGVWWPFMRKVLWIKDYWGKKEMPDFKKVS